MQKHVSSNTSLLKPMKFLMFFLQYHNKMANLQHVIFVLRVIYKTKSQNGWTLVSNFISVSTLVLRVSKWLFGEPLNSNRLPLGAPLHLLYLMIWGICHFKLVHKQPISNAILESHYMIQSVLNASRQAYFSHLLLSKFAIKLFFECIRLL